jgi:hypothetical protein
MTVTAHRPGASGHERPATAAPIPATRIPAQRTPLDAVAGPALFVPPVPSVDAAAGLGPWTPPSQVPDPAPSRRGWVLLAVVVTLMIVGIATAVAFAVHAAPPSGTGTDARYLSSARAMSGLTGADASDAQLVRVGSTACVQLDDHPTPAGLADVRSALQAKTGWSGHDAAEVVAAAVGTYCPRHAGLLGQ